MVCALLAVPAFSQSVDRPNIVVLMTDNQGYGDLGVFGGVRAKTPAIDARAVDGVQVMDFQVETGCIRMR